MGFPFADKCASQEQTPPIYCGPGAGKGLIYYTFTEEVGNDLYEHTIFFKGDSFTVREDMTLKITEEKKRKGPPLDNRIRNVWDPEYKDFLECLKNKQCPTVFSKERGGLHIIRLFGLHDDEDLEVPDIPYDCDTWVDIIKDLDI